jgi:hypothetical protein
MNKPAVSVAKMQRMRRAIERDGLPFRGYVTRPDGSVEALVGEPLTTPHEAPSPIDPLDAELAEWDAKHGYGRP